MKEKVVLFLDFEADNVSVPTLIPHEKYDIEVRDFWRSTTVPPFVNHPPCLMVGDSTFIFGNEEIKQFLDKE